MFDYKQRLILANHNEVLQFVASFLIVIFILLIFLIQTHINILNVKVGRLYSKPFLKIQFYLQLLFFNFVEFFFELNLLIYIIVLFIILKLFLQLFFQICHLADLSCIGPQVFWRKTNQLLLALKLKISIHRTWATHGICAHLNITSLAWKYILLIIHLSLFWRLHNWRHTVILYKYIWVPPLL